MYTLTCVMTGCMSLVPLGEVLTISTSASNGVSTGALLGYLVPSLAHNLQGSLRTRIESKSYLVVYTLGSICSPAALIDPEITEFSRISFLSQIDNRYGSI